jgi:hypothetical protein
MHRTFAGSKTVQAKVGFGEARVGDEHKTAKSAARAGKPIWKRTVKAALKEKLDQ